MCLLLAVGLAVAFSGVGFVEYAARKIFLNPKLIATNQDHTYFAVNSVFYDPNIFGRFLALVMVLLAVTLLYRLRPREQLGATAALAIMWVALVLTLSRSGLGALLAGLMSWRQCAGSLPGRGGCGGCGGRGRRGRGHLAGHVRAGAGGQWGVQRPGQPGYRGTAHFRTAPGVGLRIRQFPTEYRRQNPNSPGGVGDSHTLPVAVAAEQGVIGELIYLGLLAAAAVMLLRGARGDPVRAALAAAFVGLVVHTLLYDDFLSDPITWTLLAVGAALARAPSREAAPEARAAAVARPIPAST